jgi:uncharacterized protein RhaS with RHS repeats
LRSEPGCRKCLEDHLGSANSATDAAGAILWREEYMPFGEPINAPAANRDKPGFTGHIHDHALGLTYMQARYYDPVIGVRVRLSSLSAANPHSMSNDPVGFAQAGPGYFNRYAYVHNDPINGIDPFGEASYLVSRPVRGGLNHMFVVVVDDKTGKVVARYSYGPTRAVGGKLVSLTASRTQTDTDDAAAYSAYAEDPAAAAKDGIFAVQINASDDAVIASGEAVDRALGTKKNPGSVKYAPLTGPQSTSDFANSNSAAYAVADRAVKIENPNGSQSLPPGSRNPGWNQSAHIPVSGVVEVSGRIESNNLSKCGERTC